MAKLMLIGKVADVELKSDPLDGQWVAKCEKHEGMEVDGRLIGCGWMRCYYTLNGATEYASDHADRGEG